MTGKAPPSRSRKDRSRTSRPYDRPNQSILGKVASTVRLFTPSWLYNVSSWVRTKTEEGVSVEEENIVEPDLTENEEEPEAQPLRTRHSGGRAKKMRLEPSASASTVPTSEASSTPYWLRPSTSRDNFIHSTEGINPSSTIPNCETDTKNSAIIANGMLLNQGDDHSENSDNSASTSGCSSLVSSQDKPHRSSGLKLNESALELIRGELKSNPAFQRQRKEVATLTTNTFFNSPRNTSQGNISLWSCGTQTPGVSPQVPSLLHSSRPSFNVSSFGRPSASNSPASKTASPFYEGSTTFGGASAYRRRQMTNLPYQLNQSSKSIRCQVKVSSSTKEFECMSSAAKRILHTLETMSTPITDAKKIPNVDKSPLIISPPSHRFKSYLTHGSSSPAPSPKAPPIVNLSTVSKMTLLKNHRSKVKNSMMELPLTEQPMVSLPAECSVSTSSESSNVTNLGSSGGGKMKTKVTQSAHISAKTKEMYEPSPEYDLPNVPLPISSMPVFKLGVKPSSGTESTVHNFNRGDRITDSEKEKVNGNHLPPFTFSNPIEYSPPTTTLQTLKNNKDDLFKFSSPLVVAAKPIRSQKPAKTEDSEIYTNRSIEDILKTLRENASSSGEERKQTLSELENEKMSSESSIKPITGFGDMFKPKTGSWSCPSCMVQNEESSVKCVACETPKVEATPLSGLSAPSGFSDFKMQVKPGSWECSTCLVRNDAGAMQCVACETKKPDSSLKRKNTDSSNDVSGSKKVSEISVANSLAKFVQNASGTWECDTCMVRNVLDCNKCIACETLRPSAGKAADKQSTFKFGGLPSQSSETGFKFGSSVSTSASTASIASGFKFGVQPSAEKSGFSFGSTILATTDSGTVKFGGAVLPTVSLDDKSSADNNQVVEGFKFGVPALTTASANVKGLKETNVAAPLTGGFQFGVPSVSTSTSSVFLNSKPISSESGGFQFSKPSTDVGSLNSGGFQYEKPAVSSADSSGFKFPGTTPFGSGIKFGEGAATESKTLSSESLSVKPPSFGGSSQLIFGNVATSKSDVIHSKTDVAQSTSETKLVHSVVTTPSVTAPIFNFGAKSNTAASLPPPGTASSALFGDNAQTQLDKKPVELTKSMAMSGSQPPAPTAGAPTVSVSFAFNPAKNLFPLPSQGVSQDTKTVALSTLNEIPRTQAPVFPFGTSTSSAPVFAFGGASVAASNSSTFAKTEPPKAIPSEPLSNVFQFGAPAKLEVKPAQAGFAFKGPTEGNFTFAPQNQVKFGATGQIKTEPANPAQQTSAPASNVFKFGNTTAPSAGGFMFGGPTKTETAPAPNAGFTFGSAPKSSGFGGFGQQNQLAVTSSMPTFNFGVNVSSSSAQSAFNQTGTAAFPFAGKNQPTTLNSTATPSPAFGTQNAQQMFGSVPSFGANTASTSAFGGNSAPASAFGSNSASPAAFGSNTASTATFGSNTASTATFGSNTASTAAFGSNAASTAAFGNSAVANRAFGTPAATPAFGAPAATQTFSNVQQAQKPPDYNFQASNMFQFGAPSEKKPALSTPQGFNFMPPTQVDANSNYTPNFNVASPPSFNFTATTPTNQPFQFAANTDPSKTSAAGPRKIRKAIRRGIRKD